MKARDFFSFDSKLLSSTFQARPVGLKNDKNGLPGYLNLIKGNLEGINFPVVFKQDSGKNLTDILDTGHGSLFLISDHMKNILEENNLTGWRTFPVKLYDKKRNEIFNYHGFSIIGRCSHTSYEKSEIIEKRLIAAGPICKYYKSVFIEEWDGTDFFIPNKTRHIFITKKAADALINHKITNMLLENLADIETDVSTIQKHS